MGSKFQGRWGRSPVIVRGLVKKWKFGLAAILVPLSVRSIPEIVAGPFPVGFDTINSYIPFMLDWGARKYSSSFNPLIGGWILYAVFGVSYFATRIDPILITKVAAPLLFGFLGLTEYYFARTFLSWTQRKSLLLVGVASLDFMLLRLSWDLLRNTLGLALLLLAIAWKPKARSQFSIPLRALLAWLVVAAHLLAGTVLIGILAISILVGNRKIRAERFLILVPGAVQLATSLVGLQFSGTAVISSSTGSEGLLSASGYALYLMLPFAPLVFIGARTLRNRTLEIWTAFCIIGIFAGGTPVAISSDLVTANRWLLMLGAPFAYYMTEGLTRASALSLPRPRISEILRFGNLGVVVFLGLAFLALPAEHSFPYFSNFVPTSMLQSSVPLNESQSVIRSFSWLSQNIQNGSVLMVVHPMYGWSRLFFQANDPTVSFAPGVTLQYALVQTLRMGYVSVYTVWWANNQGWYGDAAVPNGFSVLHVDGEIGVFVYKS